MINQIEGGAIQATSWTLKESLPVEGGRVFNDRWSRYPILRFSEVPAIEVQIVASDQPSLGAGEAALGPTAAAIANALYNATGVRIFERSSRGVQLTPTEAQLRPLDHRVNMRHRPRQKLVQLPPALGGRGQPPQGLSLIHICRCRPAT